MKRLFLIVFCAVVHTATAQNHFHNPAIDMEFSTYVKSVDEFMQRFNGTESHPDVAKSDSNSRQKNIAWLFNFDVPATEKTAMMAQMKEFIDSVCSNNVRLSFNDSTWFARTHFQAKYKNKPVELTMLLRTEPTPKRNYCWKLCGIKGLETIGFPKDNRQFGISSTDNDVGFLELMSIFANNSENAFGYMSPRNSIDQLSVFLTLIKTEQISYGYTTELEYIFTSVPGYVFYIREYGRQGKNAGWLISKIEKCTDKNLFINNLIK